MPFKTRGRVAAMGLAAVLAAGMCPAFASATELTTGSIATEDVPTVQTQANKKTVYVLTGITQVAKGKSKSEDKFFDYTEKQAVKLTYNKKGLLSKSSYTREYTSDGPLKQASSKSARKWTYDKKDRIATLKRNIGTLKYAYSSDGKLKKAAVKANYPVKFTFAYKSGKIAKIKAAEGTGKGVSNTYTFSYKAGRVAKVKRLITAVNSTFVRSFAYDGKGNIASMGGEAIPTTYNAKGQIEKRVFESANEKAGTNSVKTITYKYKAIKVSSGVASKVKAQQWALLNENLNLAIDAQIGEGTFNLGNMFQ